MNKYTTVQVEIESLAYNFVQALSENKFIILSYWHAEFTPPTLVG